MTVTLDPMEEQDAAIAVQILTHPEVVKSYMVPDLDDGQAYKLFTRLKELSHDPGRFVRGIYWEDSLAGFLNDVEMTGSHWELGWVIHPKYHNRGFATRAVKLAVRELFSRGIPAVVAGAFDWNAASIRVMEKCGMEKIALTDTIEYRGKTHTCVYYRIEAE